MATVVPIFDEADSFIGVWAQNRGFTPTLGSLAELMSLSEPALNALTKRPSTRTENYGVVRVGSNISFRDGVYLMIDGERAPAEEVGAGRSFLAVAYHGIPIAKRVTYRPAPSSPPRKKWWPLWRFLRRAPPTDQDLTRIQVGMTTKEVVQIAGGCESITTMGAALSQLKGYVASGEALASMNSTELWVYVSESRKHRFFVTNGIVDEIKVENKT